MRVYRVKCPRCSAIMALERESAESFMAIIPEHKILGEEKELDGWLCAGGTMAVDTLNAHYREAKA